MRRLTRVVILINALLIAAAIGARAQSSSQETREETGAITGRVTVGGKPATGVIVTLERYELNPQRGFANTSDGPAIQKTTSDEEGRFRLEGVVAGRYNIAPFAPALVASSVRVVTVTEGETVEAVDFALVRGGVITGRVTKSDGQPLIDASISLAPADEHDRQEQLSFHAFATDDRGIYRLYGLPAGRYVVSVRESGSDSGMTIEVKRRYHKETFHPGVAEKAKATIVEVTAGGETTGIDIKLGLASLTFQATGRLVDAETGKPLSNIMTAYDQVQADGLPRGFSGMGPPSNSKGEFRIGGLLPGRYAAFAAPGVLGESDYYSDTVAFEVKGEDVKGLEIKLHRGSSMSGVAVTEGVSDPSIAATLSQLEIWATTQATEGRAPSFTRAKIGPDGSFFLRGVTPGKTHLMLNTFFNRTPLSILRVEHNGIEQRAGIEVAPGEQVKDIRVVLTQSTGVIRGQVKVEAGALPKDARLTVSVRRQGSELPGGSRSTEADTKGNFLIEGLSPGDYEVTLVAELDPAGNKSPFLTVTQSITVTNEAEAQMVLVLDLSKKGNEK